MRARPPHLRGPGLVGLGLLAAGGALAQAWTGFEAAFPAFPCADGWAGCVVHEQRVGQQGDPMPADLRLDWFELTPTAAFSPFVGLSAYTGEVPVVPGPVPDVVKRPPVPDDDDAPAVVQVPAPPPRPTTPKPARPKPPRPAPPGPDAFPECADLVALEDPAKLGDLTAAQVRCLESRVASDDKPTTKKHASLVLIAQAWAKDRDQWERLVLRHLDDIDRSDPALCYKLALHLEPEGPRRAEEVIRWSELAMTNARRQWSGEAYTARMYSLHRLRSKAASELWYVADKRHTDAPTNETREAADRYRAQAKNFAKEWYDYARQAGKDTTHPRELCISAAGTADFCEAQ